MRNKLGMISEGMRVGQMIVGELVYNVQQHPLFATTRQSYLQHGRLRECLCDCGEMVLYSENALQTNFLKSCGCLRKKRHLQQFQDKQDRTEQRLYRDSLTQQIKAVQTRLKDLKSAPEHIRNSQESNLQTTALCAELRKLLGMKGHATRKLRS